MGKFERKFGKYALHNLSLYLIICYAFGFLINWVNPDFLSNLMLDPYLILHGQVWRIFTWILIPPSSSNIFFTLIMLYFYYSIGTTLERTWGTFYYNVYLFSGMLFTVIGSFLYMIYLYFSTTGEWHQSMNVLAQPSGAGSFTAFFGLFSTYYINMSIFLGFAATYPDMEVMLMFILPIKVKWMGIIYGAMLVYDIYQGGIPYAFVIGASLLNFGIFFLSTRRKFHRGPKQLYRQHVYKKEVKRASPVSRHKCAICGRTDQEYPDLEFRFCSKCEGHYEYCQDHLFTHQHIHLN